MLDRVYIRENPEEVTVRLEKRGVRFDLEGFRNLDEEERSLRVESEQLRALRNRTSDEIALLKREQKDSSGPIERMKQVGARIKDFERRLAEVEERLREFLSGIPNLPHKSVPVGPDDSANRLVREGGQRPHFDFPVKDHVELGTKLGILDLERAAKITGARFSISYGEGARLERALINFMLDLHTREHGYREIQPPFMANRNSFFGTGNLPKFEEDLFAVGGTDYFLIPTAEVPVTNVFAGETLESDTLPVRFVAFTPCFRSEAGSHGRDTRGLIRQHQFNKVELVRFSTPEDSYEELEKLTGHAEEVLRRLGLHYRVVTLSTGDMGFSAAKTYDLEVWLPSQETYREISSCSNFEDFQARRAEIRFRREEGGRSRFLHTLNGSGLAVGRTWVAILENYQTPDGSVRIPEVLRPYMDGLEVIQIPAGA